MSIEEDLKSQLKDAMRAKDRKTSNVIRMLNTKVMEKRTSKGFSGEVDDKVFLTVIGAYKKSLDKAMKQFEDAGEKGKENLEELRFESGFCAAFLPTMMGEEEARGIVKGVLANLGITDPKMGGRAVGAVMKEHKGKVEASTVKKLVDELLGN